MAYGDIKVYQENNMGSFEETTLLSANNILPCVIGTQINTTGVWTGNATTISYLYDGLKILYFLPFSGSGDATLNLVLKDGITTTGNINCYYDGIIRISTQFKQYSHIILIYRENLNIGGTNYTGWWSQAMVNMPIPIANKTTSGIVHNEDFTIFASDTVENVNYSQDNRMLTISVRKWISQGLTSLTSNQIFIPLASDGLYSGLISPEEYTVLINKQVAYNILTTLGNLINASGVLSNDGTGNLSWNNISNLVPYTGATSDVDLGSHYIKAANGAILGSGTMSNPTHTNSLCIKGNTSNFNINVQDGGGRVNYLWNANVGSGSGVYIVSNEVATKITQHHTGFTFSSSPVGIAGNVITWIGLANFSESGVWLTARGNTTDFNISPSGVMSIGCTVNIPALTSTMLKIDANHNLVPAVAGTDYAVPGSSSGSSFWTDIIVTYISATSFSVPDDMSNILVKGVVIKWTDSVGTLKIGIVTTSTYSTITTINIVGSTVVSTDINFKYGPIAEYKEFILPGYMYPSNSTDISKAFFINSPMYIISSDFYVRYSISSGNTIIDINKNGSTLFNNKPTILANTSSSINNSTTSPTTIAVPGNYITVDIDSSPSIPPIDGYVYLYYIYQSYLNK